MISSATCAVTLLCWQGVRTARLGDKSTDIVFERSFPAFEGFRHGKSAIDADRGHSRIGLGRCGGEAQLSISPDPLIARYDLDLYRIAERGREGIRDILRRIPFRAFDVMDSLISGRLEQMARGRFAEIRRRDHRDLHVCRDHGRQHAAPRGIDEFVPVAHVVGATLDGRWYRLGGERLLEFVKDIEIAAALARLCAISGSGHHLLESGSFECRDDAPNSSMFLAIGVGRDIGVRI